MPNAQRLKTGRSLALVDVENCCGIDRPVARDVAVARSALLATGVLPTGTQVVIGTSADRTLLEAGIGWRGPRLVIRKGHDGADLALLDVALNEGVAARFDTVVICSGDGIFAMAARYLRERGVRVVVVGRSGSISRLLRQEADTVLEIRPLTPAQEVA